MSRSALKRLLVPIAVLSLSLGLAACGDDKKESSGDSTPASEYAAPPSELVLKVLKEGTGATVKSGDSVTVDYQGTTWANGQIFDQSYGKEPATFTTDGVVPGFGAALVGQKVGSQVVVGIPPEFGYGASGQPSAGISGTDTLVFVIEIKSAGLEVKNCNAKPGAASNAVTVSGKFGKAATPKFAKPLRVSGVQRTVVKAGTGKVTKAGDNLSMWVSIYNGRTGESISSSDGTLQVGDAQIPDAFQAGLSCLKVGSRVVTVFPAKDVPSAVDGSKILETDSIVLVTDIVKVVPSSNPAPAELPEVKDWTDAPEVTFNGTEPPTLTLPKA